MSLQARFPIMNNKAKCEVVTLGLQMAISLGINSLCRFRDSQLVAWRVNEEHEVKDEDVPSPKES